MFCMLGGIFACRWLSYSVAGRGVVKANSHMGHDDMASEPVYEPHASPGSMVNSAPFSGNKQTNPQWIPTLGVSEMASAKIASAIDVRIGDVVGSVFQLELGVDFDRGFSSGFSPPNYFRPFSVFCRAHTVPKSVTKSVFFLRKTQGKKSATKSVAKSVPLGRVQIHCKIRHNHQKNPP